MPLFFRIGSFYRTYSCACAAFYAILRLQNLIFLSAFVETDASERAFS
jgi:hypothetical protein